MYKQINIIVAYDKNRGIGCQGRLPWKCSADMKFFKEKTMGNVVIMGRKTYESIGKPLPGRKNIVLTGRHQSGFFKDNNIDINCPELFCKSGITNAIDLASDLYTKQPQDIWIIGGAQIYKQALQCDIVDNIYATEFEDICSVDVFFPLLPTSYNKWAVSWMGEGDSSENHARWDRYQYIRIR